MAKIALIFPGQGSQSVGMARDVVESSPRAAQVMRRADEVLGLGLSDICFHGPAETLEQTEIQQPAILASSVAIYEALVEKGLPSDAFHAAAGLSLGEYTALHVAGAVSFDDSLRLVQTRGRLMQQAGQRVPGGMVSVLGADAEAAEKICAASRGDDVLSPANFNCPGQVVLSGDAVACQRSLKVAEEMGFRAISLKVSGAFHTTRMQPAADGLFQALSDTRIQPPRIPVIANVDAQAHGDSSSIRQALQRQLTHPVQWQRSIEFLLSQGFDTFVEIGPGRVLTGLMKKINRSAKAINISSAADLRVDWATA